LGLAGAGVTTSISLGNQAGTPVTRTMVGAHYALGMEFQASRELSIRLEISQSNFGGMAYPVGSGSFNSGGGNLGNVATHSLNISATNLTVGALFEF
jgi:opacity protein-like surface antigen